ncbi:MAG: dockerin type I repeat-containing protein [Firmicutes bacterium]|nr:dockerin type I repeat-containing protein [Bacillota bacterium]
MIKRVFKRYVSLLLTAAMVFSFIVLFPQEIFGEVLEIDVSGLEADYTDGSWTVSGTGLNGSATGTAAGGCSNATSMTSVLTLKNISGSLAQLSFDYSKPVIGPEGYVMIDGTAVTEAGAFTKDLENNGSIEIEIFSGTEGANTSSIQLINIAVIVKQNVTVTFDVPQGNGSYTVNGEPVTSAVSITQYSIVPFELSAVPADGYKLEGWYSSSKDRFISSLESLNLYFDEDQTVYPVFIPSEVTVWDVSGRWFTDLDEAFSFASSSNIPKITLISDGTLPAGTYTVPNGKTLLIPYENTGIVSTTAPDIYKSTAAITPSAYRTLTMAPGTKLIVNGSLCVNAKVNSNNTQYTGATSVKFGYIRMEEDSSIELNNGSDLYCWGYICGSGYITALSGSNVYEPFEIADVRGGTATTVMDGNSQKVLPFQQYYLQNIETPLTLMYGANEYGVGTVTVQNSTENPTVSYIGPFDSSLFQLTSGSFTKTYDPETDRVYYDVNGDSSINSISLEVGLKVDTTKYVLPLMQSTTIRILAGTTAVNQSVYMIPGCELQVGSSASLIIASETDLYVYDRDEYVGNEFVFSNADLKPSFYQPDRSASNVFTADRMVDAKLDVNGEVTVEGNLYTTESKADITSSLAGGKITFVNAPASSSTVYQVTQGGADGTEVFFHEIPVTAPWLRNGALGRTEDPEYIPTAGVSEGQYFSYCEVEDRWHAGDPCEAKYILDHWTWADDFSSAEATFIEETAAYEKTAVATVTSETVDPTCEETGQTVYTASVAFSGTIYTDTKTVTIEALGHDWSDIKYSWSLDNSKCTALKACSRDHAHDIKETVDTTSEITQEPSDEGPGVLTYTAVFDHSEFETQTKSVVFPIEDGITVVFFGSESFTEGENYYAVGNEVKVLYDLPCKVGYYDVALGKYVALQPEENEDGSYSFTAPEGVTEVLLVIKGDATGDGGVNLGDAARIKAYFRRKTSLDEKALFAADITGDGAANLGDAARITAIFRRKYNNDEW